MTVEEKAVSPKKSAKSVTAPMIIIPKGRVAANINEIETYIEFLKMAYSVRRSVTTAIQEADMLIAAVRAEIDDLPADPAPA